MPSAVKYALIALALVGGIAALAWTSHYQLTMDLPPRVECRDMSDALARAQAYRHGHGGNLVRIVGTGSMSPYIPAAAAGRDPRATVVAFAVYDPAAWSLVQPGDLCLYVAEWSHLPTIHQAVENDALGWIMSGLHNPRSEPAWRMTRANFLGRAIVVFTWPQSLP